MQVKADSEDSFTAVFENLLLAVSNKTYETWMTKQGSGSPSPSDSAG